MVKLNERVDRMEKTVDIRIGESTNPSLLFSQLFRTRVGLTGRFDTNAFRNGVVSIQVK